MYLKNWSVQSTDLDPVENVWKVIGELASKNKSKKFRGTLGVDYKKNDRKSRVWQSYLFLEENM